MKLHNNKTLFNNLVDLYVEKYGINKNIITVN